MTARLAAVLAAVAVVATGCQVGKPAAEPHPRSSLHEAPFGLDCTPAPGVAACTIEVDNAGAPGCQIVHARGEYSFRCLPEQGWRRIGRTQDGKHGVCFLHDPAIVACSDGYRDSGR